jgi:hypothetical protein
VELQVISPIKKDINGEVLGKDELQRRPSKFMAGKDFYQEIEGLLNQKFRKDKDGN